LTRSREGINDNDLIRIIVRHDALNQAVVVPLQKAREMTVEKILDKIESVLVTESVSAGPGSSIHRWAII
jgi:hypothetical protein